DQINLTDEESRIMKVAGGGFEQCYNAQAGVDAPTMLVVATTLTQAPNDKQQVQPMIKVLQEQAPQLGDVKTLIADTGYCSEKNILACEEARMEPLIAVARQDHHPHWSVRFTEPEPLKLDATPMQTMVHRLATQAGKAAYALRKQTVEPVFGIIKSVMGFRQFSLRGLRKVTGEWNLVCLAWNVKRMAVLRLKVG
ncbi:MAG: transposase, partial [Polycyclovorans sp.]|nr:transposase [Polycyclovorans sp.]